MARKKTNTPCDKGLTLNLLRTKIIAPKLKTKVVSQRKVKSKANIGSVFLGAFRTTIDWPKSGSSSYKIELILLTIRKEFSLDGVLINIPTKIIKIGGVRVFRAIELHIILS